MIMFATCKECMETLCMDAETEGDEAREFCCFVMFINITSVIIIVMIIISISSTSSSSSSSSCSRSSRSSRSTGICDNFLQGHSRRSNNKNECRRKLMSYLARKKKKTLFQKSLRQVSSCRPYPRNRFLIMHNPRNTRRSGAHMQIDNFSLPSILLNWRYDL